MVGVFCLMCTIIVILYMSGNTNETELEICPTSCACLGVYAECSHRNFTKLPTNIPSWISIINLNSNHIQFLDKTVLGKLDQLTELKLNRNKISHLSKDVFIHQKHLKILELNRNNLVEIEGLTFQSLEKLRTLKLRRNRIRHLSDGAFWGLKHIDTLELDLNYIPTVSRLWTYGLDHLRSLSLSNNVITQIEADVWNFCHDLEELNLSTNHISALHKGTFKFLSKLEKLNLNNNNISHIEEGAFFNTPALKELFLNNNKLSWTVEDMNGAFVGLNNLFKFHLASNSIKSISKNVFTELKNVAILDLSGNNVTTVHNSAFSDMIHLKELYLKTGTLLCDCNIHWFSEWLRTYNFKNVSVNCAYPSWLRGKSITAVPLTNLTCDDVPKPRLTEEPKMMMALKGENISMFCKAVSSSPASMTFLWKRDNIQLRNADIKETASSPDGRHTERTSELKLYNVSHSDQGKYQCVVSNNFGTTYSQKYRISVLIFPKFSKMPTDITVHAGRTARLECAAHGEPQPQIAWQKDGGNDFPAARERRMHVMPTDDVFFIVNAKTADMGIYSCTAQNLAGVIVANATLTVLEMPSFVKPMENKEIMAGEPIVLECMASGSPKPTLTWLKDGGPLKATDRHFFTAEDQLMIIVDTTLSDAGTYECLMNNSLGSEHGSSELLVIPGTPVPDADMMGIIIITVVCCAVGTSVVWVVIIYQTRRRINTSAASVGANLSDVGDTRVYVDNASEHSSCKDSGTGDSSHSAKRSSVGDNCTLLSNSESGVEPRVTPAPIFINSSHSPLLSSPVQQTYPRSTNHDRDEGEEEPVLLDKEHTDAEIV